MNSLLVSRVDAEANISKVADFELNICDIIVCDRMVLFETIEFTILYFTL